MVLYNLTNGITIAVDLQYLDSLKEKTLGLLSKKHSPSIYFQTKFGIHTFGLKETIDVIILDNEFKVVKLAEVKPNNIFLWNPKFNKVIELKKGSIKKSSTKLNDQLKIL